LISTQAAKLLKYLGYSTLCDYAFGIFMVGWIVGRHGIYNMITWSVYRDSGRLITPACYSRASNSIIPGLEVSWPITRDTFLFKSDTVCFTDDVRRVFLILLVGLQIITLIWLYMIFRVAWRVVTGAGADDTRSEDELSDDDQDIQEEQESSGDSEELEQMEEIGEAIGEAEIRAVNGLKKKETVVDKYGRVTGSRAKRGD
jgi:acyl-CoA-dependent ceramide synthase